MSIPMMIKIFFQAVKHGGGAEVGIMWGLGLGLGDVADWGPNF